MTNKYKKKEIKKAAAIIRFIKSLEKWDNVKAFNDYLKRKEIKR